MSFIKLKQGLKPLKTNWWDGIDSLILDTTNPLAKYWFIEQLNAIREKTKIDSFKFDAGEVGWLPKNFSLINTLISPNEYSTNYARMASFLGNMIEVRVGSKTQDLPIFVRMLDKYSKWSNPDNGLKSVLTSSLVMSILGYPFILPGYLNKLFINI